MTSLPTADRGNLTLVHAANPSLEGRIRMPLIDNFGNEFFAEQERLVNSYGGGWLYYTRTNPATGGNEPKASYVEAIDWDGSPAAIGAGIYMRDLPGTCSPDEVNAAALEAEPGAERLQELVRCAAYRFEEAGYFAAFELQNNPRWRSGSIYLFVLNSRGMQYFSSNPVTINGVAAEEWSGSLFMERDVASPAAAFDESTLLLRRLESGERQRAAQGCFRQARHGRRRGSAGRLRLLPCRRRGGLGYTGPMIGPASRFLLALGALLLPALSLAQTPCADKSVAASAIRTREDIRAFVQCAREYAQEHGTTEAHRAFHESARWKSGPIYLGVIALAARGEDSTVLVYPPERSREGNGWGTLIDAYGNDFYKERYRIATQFGEGWIYYSFVNPVTGRGRTQSRVLENHRLGRHARSHRRGHLPARPAGNVRPCRGQRGGARSRTRAERLQELVRCAAYRFEEAGYFAAFELQNNPRWRSGSIYLFVLNSRGMQYFSSNPVTINGAAVEEWSGSLFMERDVASPAAAFDESTLYYDALNPANGSVQRKVAFVKRVMVGGEALLVGSGYYLP